MYPELNFFIAPKSLYPPFVALIPKSCHVTSCWFSLFADDRPFFTREPSELRGERLQAQLVKSTRGLGFTIVGGDDSEEEFLQIKSVVPNGPAWLDGRLKTGEEVFW
jgi:hypothetical protein